MIEVISLVKRFGDEVVLNGISFNVEKGEIFGLIGPNGAGKTTTINILIGLALPTSGRAIVSGYDITRNPLKVKNIIGVAFQSPCFDHHFNLWENLYYNGLIYGMPRNKLSERVNWALSWCRLDKHRNKTPSHLSGGMMRRLILARAMLNDPEILFLDEPTTGLDPQSRRLLWDSILDLRDQGKTILLTTHYMEEADSLCDRLAFIDSGKIIAEGSPNKLKCLLNHNLILRIKLNDAVLNNSTLHKMRSFPGVGRVVANDGQIDIALTDRHAINTVLSNVLEQSEIYAVSMVSPSLEDVFFHLTGRGLRD